VPGVADAHLSQTATAPDNGPSVGVFHQLPLKCGVRVVIKEMLYPLGKLTRFYKKLVHYIP
jgi:hypothetical protein